MVLVKGAAGEIPFVFGNSGEEQLIVIPDFYMATTLVTQALWQAVMPGDNERFLYKGDLQPVEHISWNEISRSASS